MSECVVLMEMPENCEACPMCGTASRGNGRYELWCMCGGFGTSSRKRPDNCPIICALPEGHGRLVDADAAESIIRKWFEKIKLNPDILLDGVKSLPTIVPAERRANDGTD